MYTKYSSLRLMALIIPAIILMGCFGEGDGKPKIAGTEQTVVINDDDYVLVFADEFNVDGAPSAANWNIETGYGPNNDGNGNNEWQLYTDSPDNVRVEGGNLVISALCSSPPCFATDGSIGVRDGTITSGKINSLDKVEFRYGRIEARIKPPVGKGTWPAFWALGANHPDIGWPRSGEIDFMEMHNAFSNDRTTHFTMHWCDQSIQAPDECTFPLGRVFYTQNRAFNTSLGDAFHIFAADWNENRIIGSIDGIPYFSRTIDATTMDEFLKEFYLILNVAMGGTLGSDNQPPDGNEVFPQTMLVDYIRIYQCPDCVDDEPEPSDDFLIDFEDDGGPYSFNDFEGGVGFVTDNPDMTGNPSARVAKLLKFAGGAGELFAGTTLSTAEFNVPVDSSFTMKAWSERPGPINILFKLEGGPDAELEVAHPGGGWRELTFDFPGISGTFDGITFILDLGTPGADPSNTDDPNWTVYIDDILLVPGDGGGDPGGGDPDGVIDFEPAGGPYMFNEFEGGVAFIAENPDTTGINSSANSAKMLKFAGGQNFAGTTLQLNNPLDTADGTTFKVKVWGNRPSLPGTALTFKLEGAAPGLPKEAVVTHGNTGWEELTFELPSASGTITGITFIFDNGIAGATPTDPPSEDPNWTFYVDDITQIPDDDDPGGGDPGGGDPNTLADFEAGGGPYVFEDFEGGVGSVVANPDPTGINTSDSVGQMQKFAGAVFAGSTLQLAVDVVAGSSFTMQVWSQRTVPVLFKLEGTPDVEASAMHGGTGWELLTFDLSSASGSYTGITLIFDIGVAGDAANNPDFWTFYFDAITVVPPDGGGGDPGAGDPVVLSDFEPAGGPYVFEDFEGGVGSVVANPDPTGINTSDSVGQMQKFAGAVFAGSTLQLAVDVVAGSSFTMQVWSQRTVPVLFKLEGTPDVEASAMHGGTGWELLTFDLSSASGSYTGITLIFDLGVAGDAANNPDFWTFYFDAITLVPPDGGGGDPGAGDPVVLSDFEPAGGPYVFEDFEGGVGSVVANPDPTGINTSDSVGQMQKFAGAVFAGSTLQLAVDVVAGSSFTMQVWSQRTVPVLFKLEGTPDVEASAMHGGTGWELLTFDLSSASGSYTGITLIFDLGVAGDAANNPDFWTFYFDAITVVPPDGGGGDPGAGDPVVLSDFEPAGGPYVFEDFEGGVGSVVANPDPTGINTSDSVGQMQKFAGAVFAGSTLQLAVDVVAGSSFTMQVWSQRTVPVLFKLEGTPDVEASAMHGGTGWELLTFDLSSASGSYTGITLIFDLGVAGDAANNPDFWTFYFDSITLVPPDGSR